VKIFIRIVCFLIVLVLISKERSFAHDIQQHDQSNIAHHQYPLQQSLKQKQYSQLSPDDLTAFQLPDHAVNIDQYFLDGEGVDLKEVKAGPLTSSHTAVLLLVFNHLLAKSCTIILNTLREKEISAAYTTPRYILHHNLRIPSC